LVILRAAFHNFTAIRMPENRGGTAADRLDDELLEARMWRRYRAVIRSADRRE